MQNKMMKCAALAGAILIASSSCKQERPNVAIAPPVVAPSVPNAKGGPLSERLDREGTTRPAAALRAEDVFSALVKSGLEIKERMQVLAAPIGAAYCQNAHTANDVILTVCEFEDEASAEKGKATSLAAVQVENRQVVLHHATTLQVIESPKSEQSAKSAAAAIAAFNAL